MDHREGPVPSDVTRSNRQTYDRIADAYAARQVHRASQGEASYGEFEQAFLAAVPPGGIVGDLGCGPAFDGLRFAHLGYTVVGVDLSIAMLRIAEANLASRVIQGDLRSLPLATSCLDGLWNAASLLHVPEHSTMTVLQEFRRVLKPCRPLVLVTALGDGWAREPVPSHPHEYRYFFYRNRSALVRQLNDAGFEIQIEEEAQSNRHWWHVLVAAS